MAVTKGNEVSGATNATSASLTITTGAGPDNEIRVGVMCAANESVSTVIWDSGGAGEITGTLIRAEQNTGSVRAEIWQINDPPASTTDQVSITMVTKARFVAYAIEFSGADADTGSDDAGSAPDAATSVSNTALNVVSGDWVIDALAIGGSQNSTEGANQTEIVDNAFHASISGAGSQQDGANGGVMSWSSLGTNDIAHAAVRVPAAAAAGVSITPPAANLQLSTTAPTVLTPVGITIPAANLQLSTTAPALNFAISPPAANLQLTSTAPVLDVTENVSIEIPAANLQFSTTAPLVNFAYTIEIPAANLQFSATAPGVTVGGDIAIIIPAADLQLSTTAPILAVTVDAKTRLLPGFGAVYEASGDERQFPGLGVINETVVVGNVHLAPAAAQLAFSTTAPTVDTGADVSIEIPAANLQISTTAPIVQVPANIDIEIPSANLQFSTAAAIAGFGLSPGAGQLQISTAAPELLQNYNRVPDAAQLEISTTAPIVTVPINIEIPAEQLAFSTTAPAVQVSGPVAIEIPAAQLEISTTAPTAVTFIPIIDGHRFYADDGGEAASTSISVEDATLFVDVSSGDFAFQLRILIKETGGVDGKTTNDYQLVYSKNSGPVTDLTTVDGGDGVRAVAAGLTNDAATTNRSTDGITDPGTGSFIAGEQSTDGLVDDFQLTAGDFTELVYGVEFVQANVDYQDLFAFGIHDELNNLILNTGFTWTLIQKPLEIPAANLQISTTAPTVSVPVSIEIPAAQLAFSTTAPSIEIGVLSPNIEIPAANLGIGGHVPILEVSNLLALEITDTDILRLPVDYQLHGRPPPIAAMGNTIEGESRISKVKKIASGSKLARFGEKPSFTVTTSRRGYD